MARRGTRPMAAWTWMTIAAVAVVTAIWVTIGWLLATTRATPAYDADRARVRVEIVRTGLAAGAGVGAAVGLMLGFRRQQRHEMNGDEERAAMLFSSAGEQLGSDKAPVRMAALYTLERLADDHPHHQQTIVNILCAYLRMPHTPPGQIAGPRGDTIRDHHRAYRAARAGRPVVPPAVPADSCEEHRVRLAAERILTDHLRKAPAGGRFWRNIDIDLSGATLTDPGLRRCATRTARFDDATFIGDVPAT